MGGLPLKVKPLNLPTNIGLVTELASSLAYHTLVLITTVIIYSTSHGTFTAKLFVVAINSLSKKLDRFSLDVTSTLHVGKAGAHPLGSTPRLEWGPVCLARKY
jgi:hypothetical protein